MNQVTFRRIGALAVAGCAAAVIVGCKDWERAGDEDTWNDDYNARYSWVDFSGVYEDPDGGFIVEAFVAPGSSTLATNTSSGGTGVRTETVGTGNGIQAAFGGNLGSTPIIPGSLTIRGILPGGNVETFADNGSGALNSNLGNVNVGTINYFTGVFTVTFLFPVQPATDVTATYIAGLSSSLTGLVSVATPEQPGSTRPIYTFTVFQDAYQLTFRDNYGDLYRGRIREVQTTGGGNDDTSQPGQAGIVTATFEASGNGIVISGVLEADYTAAQQATTATGLGQQAAAPRTGTLANRVIRGVWMERTGDTGDIVAVSQTPEDVVSSTSTNRP